VIRALALLYGGACYLLTGAVVVYLAGFLCDAIVLKSINDGGVWSPKASAAVDCILIALFGLQHSGMARTGFKRFWTRMVPPPIERSTYVLLSNAALIVLLVFWQPITLHIWDLRGTLGEWPIWLLAALGTAIVVVASFQIDHRGLMGLRQVWDYATRRQSGDLPFQTPGLYRFVRHPLMVGLLIAFWATPYLTVGRLLFNAGMTAYILLALRWEERDLQSQFGSAYADYRRRVPMLLPWKRGKP
jgi:protein-S-isoprenylcysteine O-methyltransferase Ste14